jgi:hypothetical protein
MTRYKIQLFSLGLALVAVGCDQLVRAADPGPAGSAVVRAKGPAPDRSAFRAFRSIYELLKVIRPLTDRRVHDGRTEDAFELVLPSLPGCGVSGTAPGVGWTADRDASAAGRHLATSPGRCPQMQCPICVSIERGRGNLKADTTTGAEVMSDPFPVRLR